MSIDIKSEALKNFLKYIKFDTKSDLSSKKLPSSDGQKVFAKYLVQQLKTIGLENISIDKHCYIMATLPANIKSDVTIGFVSHMDTAPETSGTNIKASVINNYDGKDILLNKKNNIVLSPKKFPALKQYVNQDIVVTDGTTLLGADDKAGIAAIITAMRYLHDNPQIKHPKIRIAFTPDEEVGRGTEKFDTKKFGVDFAYTMDGGAIGEFSFENFNAVSAWITINGRNMHPGYAKNKMINSTTIACEFNLSLPVAERPEHTEGKEGFFHLLDIKGNIEKTKMMYIIRDFDKKGIEKKKETMLALASFLEKKYKISIDVKIKASYNNMYEKIKPHKKQIIEPVISAMNDLGIKANIHDMRGGTDGAMLSFMGVPTPNIFAGGLNFHSIYEFLPVDSLAMATKLILKIVQNV